MRFIFGVHRAPVAVETVTAAETDDWDARAAFLLPVLLPTRPVYIWFVYL